MKAIGLAVFLLACLLAAGLFWGPGGCDELLAWRCGRAGAPRAQEPPAQSRARPEQAETRRPGPASVRETSLAAMSRRVAGVVAGEVGDYIARYARRGLVQPASQTIMVRTGQAAALDQPHRLMTERVAQALKSALSGIEGLSLTDGSPDDEQHHLVLDCGIACDLNGCFDAVECAFALRRRHESRTFSDRFTDVGLVYVRSDRGGEVVVRAVNGDRASALSVRSNEWFLMPTGSYNVLDVRSKRGSWKPDPRVGLKNLWTDPAFETRHMLQADTPVPAPVDKPRSPRLEILQPAPNDTVPGVVTVAGTAEGLEGAVVRVTVMSDREYRQTELGQVRNGRWEVQGCVLGRAEDRGESLGIQARAEGLGQAVDSDVVMVMRR